MKGRLLLLAAMPVAALAACGDPIRAKATFEVATDTLVASALTGTAVDALSALDTYTHTLLRPSSSATFDIVFDIDAAGKVVLYPVQRIGGVSGRTMFRFPDQPFDAITEAPTGGYTDTTATLDVGQTVLVRAEPTYCAGSLRTDIFSKIQVLSVDLPTRQIRFQSTVDPNCGFVSFLPGVPDR